LLANRLLYRQRDPLIRTILVFLALTVGWWFALQSALFAACLYLWIAYFRPESWAWSDIFTTLNLSYFAGAYLVIRTIASRTRITVDWRSGLLLLFLAQALVSSWLGPHSAYSMGYWQEFAKMIIVSILLINIIQTTADLRLIMIVIALSLGLEAGKQGWAGLILHPGTPNDNPVPFLGDNNLVAVGMAMLIPILGVLATTATGWQKRAFQFLNIGVMYRAISTYSRGGFLSLGAISAIWFWRSPHKLKTSIAVVIAAMLILPILPQQFWDRMSTITASGEELDESQQSRLHFWAVAVEMAGDQPLTGVGQSGFPRAYDSYDWTDGQYGRERAVHSAWFGVLAELGYPGLLLFILIIFGSLRSCRRVRLAARRGELEGPLGAYAIAFETSLVAFIVGGSFVSFQYCEMLWHFFALTIALERVAATEAAALRARLEPQPQPVAASAPPEPDFAWAQVAPLIRER
jgi:putative inorganic carbon (HCO3(-)) transporter